MNVPAGNERATFIGVKALHVLRIGSYPHAAPVAQGSVRNGLPPPHRYSLPLSAPPAGTFVGCGTGAFSDHVFCPILYSQLSLRT
jgi:hypothetical protein